MEKIIAIALKYQRKKEAYKNLQEPHKSILQAELEGILCDLDEAVKDYIMPVIRPLVKELMMESDTVEPAQSPVEPAQIAPKPAKPPKKQVEIQPIPEGEDIFS